MSNALIELLDWEILVGIWGGTAIIAGMISGAYYSFEKVLGCKKDKRKIYSFRYYKSEEADREAGVVPLSILAMGICSLLSLYFGSLIASFCKVREYNISINFIYVIIVGAMVGESIYILIRKLAKPQNILLWLIVWIIGITISITATLAIMENWCLVFFWRGVGGEEFCTLLSFAISLGAPIALVIQWVFADIITWLVTKISTPLFILLKYKNNICNNCHRYSVPLKSNYAHGIRRCEHCNNTLERTKDTGKVIFTFGENNLKPERRKFILSNPDFEKKNSPIDVSEVYIDTGSCDKHLLERFITYIVNYPPKYGLKSVRIFVRGTLDDLGHLKNSILNNFARVSQI